MFFKELYHNVSRILDTVTSMRSDVDHVYSAVNRLTQVSVSNQSKGQDAVVARIVDLQSKNDEIRNSILAIVAEIERVKEDVRAASEALKIKVDRPAHERAAAILQDRIIDIEVKFNKISEAFGGKTDD